MSLISCSRNNQQNDRYTAEQVSSLHLEQTRVLDTESDSLVTIDLNSFLGKKVFDFQRLVKTIRLMPLETTEESLIGSINKVLVTASYIYVYDRYKDGGLVVFDGEGKFIRRIPNGQGPGELSRLYDIDFDEGNNQLIAYEHSFLSFYHPDGTFIRQERLPFGFYNIVSIPEGYLMFANSSGNEHMRGFQDYNLWVTDKAYRVKAVALPNRYNRIKYSAYRYIYKNKELMVTQKFNDTIYRYDAKRHQLRARYVLDFQDKKLPERYLKGSYKEFKHFAENNDFFFFIGYYLDIDRFQMITIENRYRNLRSIIYRDKMSGHLTGGTSGGFRIEDMPAIAFPQSTYRDEFISWYIPEKSFPFNTQSTMISESDKAKVSDLTNEDNPVLVFFRLKDF